jgi:hypothetical protein
VLLVFQKEKRPLPVRLEADSKASTVIPVVREDVASPPEPKLDDELQSRGRFDGCSWVWYPEGNPAQSAPPGTCYFRKQLTVPGDRKIARAVFAGAADNGFTLFINGKDAGHSDDSGEGWRDPVELDVKSLLRPGMNQLAISAFNAGNQPNPAGLLGCLRVEFEQGGALVVRVDGSWRTSRDKLPDWIEASLNDSTWPLAKEVAQFGAGPWGNLDQRGLTLGPVKADPFFGHCEIPQDLSLANKRVYLEMDDPAPEVAARVTVNDQFAGGFIGKPSRLDVTRYLKPGVNAIRIEPFAPKTARMATYAP